MPKNELTHAVPVQAQEDAEWMRRLKVAERFYANYTFPEGFDVSKVSAWESSGDVWSRTMQGQTIDDPKRGELEVCTLTFAVAFDPLGQVAYGGASLPGGNAIGYGPGREQRARIACAVALGYEAIKGSHPKDGWRGIAPHGKTGPLCSTPDAAIAQCFDAATRQIRGVLNIFAAWQWDAASWEQRIGWATEAGMKLFPAATLEANLSRRAVIEAQLATQGFRMDYDSGAIPGEGHYLKRIDTGEWVQPDGDVSNHTLSLAREWSVLADRASDLDLPAAQSSGPGRGN